MAQINVTENASKIAEQVVNHMLAPSYMANGDDAFKFLRYKDAMELALNLRWTIGPDVFRDPKIFLKEIERILKPISEAITYGEVVDLREIVKELEAEKKQYKTKIAELERYRDAVILMKGGTL